MKSLCNLHLAHELSSECVDDTSNGRSLPLADEVEIEHTLHSLGLHTAGRRSVLPIPSFTCGGLREENLLDKTSCLWVEESVSCLWAQRSAGSRESLNVVVRRKVLLVSIDTVHCCGSHDFGLLLWRLSK